MLLRITLIGFLSGIIGTFLGGIISFIFRKKAEHYLCFFMGISGGIMLAVVTFDLLEEAMAQVGIINTIVFTVFGAMISMFFKSKLHFEGMLKTGYMIFIGILIHNFPEGLAIGSSFLWKESLGITLALVIGIHNVPEGLAMALTLMQGKMKMGKILLFTIVAGIPMGFGSFMGGYVGHIFKPLIGGFLAMAGGTMLYITLEEIFPNAKATYSIIGFLLGMIIVKVL